MKRDESDEMIAPAGEGVPLALASVLAEHEQFGARWACPFGVSWSKLMLLPIRRGP